MSHLQRLHERLDEEEARQQRDAERWHALNADQCQLCEAEGPDMRDLWIACFYAVHEVVPEAISLTAVCRDDDPLRGFYLTRICKHCRGELLGHLKQWRDAAVQRRSLAKDSDGSPETGPERNIPVRVHGALRMLKEREWEEYRASKERENADQG